MWFKCKSDQLYYDSISNTIIIKNDNGITYHYNLNGERNFIIYDDGNCSCVLEDPINNTEYYLGKNEDEILEYDDNDDIKKIITHILPNITLTRTNPNSFQGDNIYTADNNKFSVRRYSNNDIFVYTSIEGEVTLSDEALKKFSKNIIA